MDQAEDVVTGKFANPGTMSLSTRYLMSITAKERFTGLLFYVLVLVTGYLTYQVLSPFLAPLAWAAVFAMMFYGVYLDIATGLARTARRWSRR